MPGILESLRKTGGMYGMQSTRMYVWTSTICQRRKWHIWNGTRSLDDMHWFNDRGWMMCRGVQRNVNSEAADEMDIDLQNANKALDVIVGNG